MFTKTELYHVKIMLGVRFLSFYGGGRERGGSLKLTLAVCIDNTPNLVALAFVVSEI